MSRVGDAPQMTADLDSQRWAVEVENLCVQFGDFYAVSDVSFRVSGGEIFGFLGANGAGKTTTIRVLCGLLIPTRGMASVGGVLVGSDTEKQVKTQVGYMSQKFTLYNDLTVLQNLNFCGNLRSLDPSFCAQRIKQLLDFVSFDYPMGTLVQNLPGGTKQQVALAASLLHDPEVLFLDEPTAGVSPSSRARFWALIKKVAKQGKTVFVTTHYMDEAEQCDRIALMREGRLIALDSPKGLKSMVFPDGVLEFEPLSPLSFKEISELQREGLFSFFEPYGLKFHAVVGDLVKWAAQKDRIQSRFKVKTIHPSLEDVFIKIVEATPS